MEQVFVSTYGSIERWKHSCVVDGCMVGQHIHEHTHTIFICAVAHGLEIIA